LYASQFTFTVAFGTKGIGQSAALMRDPFDGLL